MLSFWISKVSISVCLVPEEDLFRFLLRDAGKAALLIFLAKPMFFIP